MILAQSDVAVRNPFFSRRRNTTTSAIQPSRRPVLIPFSIIRRKRRFIYACTYTSGLGISRWTSARNEIQNAINRPKKKPPSPGTSVVDDVTRRCAFSVPTFYGTGAHPFFKHGDDWFLLRLSTRLLSRRGRVSVHVLRAYTYNTRSRDRVV